MSDRSAGTMDRQAVERRTVGSLLDSRDLYDRAVADGLAEGHFTDPACALTVGRMAGCSEWGTAGLTPALREAGELDRVGGAVALTDLHLGRWETEAEAEIGWRSLIACAPSTNGSTPTPLAALVATFRKWLHLPDETALLTVLGTVAANKMPGDPVWLLIVASPGGGKTEILVSVCRLPGVHPASTVTEASLLSGTPSKERAADAKGGLLRSIGERGIIVCKDFGSVLSMNRDARAGTLAALREVYDGSWVRHVGTDGGRKLEWTGRVGFIGGVPPTVDKHHGAMAALGERFLLLRLTGGSEREQARRAMDHAGREAEMRHELAGAVRAFFDTLPLSPEPVNLTDEQREGLIRLSALVARMRSAVERDGYGREIELVPGSESPTRLAVTLKRLGDGLAAIGVDAAARMAVVRRVALDSVPAIRRSAVEAVVRLGEPDTTAVAAALRYPTPTARRALEDLAAHGVVERVPGGAGRADRWRIGEAVREDLATVPEMSVGVREPNGTVPEMSEGVRSDEPEDPKNLLPLPAYDDISGKVPPDEEPSL